MELDEAIKGRRSIRKYKKGAVIPKEDVEAMIEAATWAPLGPQCAALAVHLGHPTGVNSPDGAGGLR